MKWTNNLNVLILKNVALTTWSDFVNWCRLGLCCLSSLESVYGHFAVTLLMLKLVSSDFYKNNTFLISNGSTNLSIFTLSKKVHYFNFKTGWTSFCRNNQNERFTCLMKSVRHKLYVSLVQTDYATSLIIWMKYLMRRFRIQVITNFTDWLCYSFTIQNRNNVGVF